MVCMLVGGWLEDVTVSQAAGAAEEETEAN